MKPRTKLKFEVTELSSRLLEISNEQKEWAYKHCLDHKGYATKTRVICLDCGDTFSPQLVKRKVAVCPHCQTKIQVEQTRKSTDKQTIYFAIAELFGEYQVVRNFELISHYKKGQQVYHYLHEILQYWILPNGKLTMIGRKHSLNFYCDSWNGDWSIRTETRNYWHGNKYNIYPHRYHPDSVFKSEYSKYGIDSNLDGLTFLSAIKYLPEQPKAETLLKSKEYSLLNYVFNNQWKLNRFWPSIKICLRNKYKIKDVSMWFDYLELLDYFMKDLSNSKYVCPKDLKKEHDRLMNKKRLILEAETRERNRLQAIERQKQLEQSIIDYVERCSKFFELEFTKNNISITVLRSVDEFKEEGDVLKHCVFTNEYYLKENSLLLSAKVDGVRTETIEIYLSNLKIEQARGYDNKPSPHHKQIVSLMKKSLPKIRSLMKKSEKQNLKLSA